MKSGVELGSVVALEVTSSGEVQKFLVVLFGKISNDIHKRQHELELYVVFVTDGGLACLQLQTRYAEPIQNLNYQRGSFGGGYRLFH